MFVVQGNSAFNIDHCNKLYTKLNDIRFETDMEDVAMATFDTAEKANEYFSLILKAYEKGEKVFYC